MRCVAISETFAHPAAMLAKRIGANIKAARESRTPKVSLEKLAAKIDPPTSYQQLARLESADRPLTIEWVEKIAKALDVDPMELLAPELLKGGQRAVRFTLDEQVANEVAQTLAEVVLGGEEPESGTVQAISLLLQELNATFAVHPEAATDAQMVRPLLTLASRRYGPAAN